MQVCEEDLFRTGGPSPQGSPLYEEAITEDNYDLSEDEWEEEEALSSPESSAGDQSLALYAGPGGGSGKGPVQGKDVVDEAEPFIDEDCLPSPSCISPPGYRASR